MDNARIKRSMKMDDKVFKHLVVYGMYIIIMILMGYRMGDHFTRWDKIRLTHYPD